MCMYICVYMYVYMYVNTLIEREREPCISNWEQHSVRTETHSDTKRFGDVQHDVIEELQFNPWTLTKSQTPNPKLCIHTDVMKRLKTLDANNPILSTEPEHWP